jgi:hypothetical protein
VNKRLKDVQVDPDVIRVLLRYDPDSGVVTWRHRSLEWFDREMDWKTWNKRWANTIAGSVTEDRYLIIRITINGHKIKTYVHRVAWCLYYGDWPRYHIDHIDGNGLNNRIANMRDVPALLNLRNSKLPVTNSSGIIGVRRSPNGKRWVAEIAVDGRTIWLGAFDMIEEAAAARKSADALYGYHENHGR